MLSTGDGEGDGENVELIAAGEGGSGGDGSGEGPRGAQRMTTPYMTKVKFFVNFEPLAGQRQELARNSTCLSPNTVRAGAGTGDAGTADRHVRPGHGGVGGGDGSAANRDEGA